MKGKTGKSSSAKWIPEPHGPMQMDSAGGTACKRGGKISGKKPKARADKMARGGKAFKPGGEKGKLHREMGISTAKKIPAKRLQKATHSKNPEIKRDAIRAETMKKWKH